MSALRVNDVLWTVPGCGTSGLLRSQQHGDVSWLVSAGKPEQDLWLTRMQHWLATGKLLYNNSYNYFIIKTSEILCQLSEIRKSKNIWTFSTHKHRRRPGGAPPPPEESRKDDPLPLKRPKKHPKARKAPPELLGSLTYDLLISLLYPTVCHIHVYEASPSRNGVMNEGRIFRPPRL